MNRVRVSVIMPSLNVSGYIDEAIESVREQTLDEIEIICVDAGSTDGTREKIAKHAREDNRIVVIDSPAKSYGYQVNMGIDIARGEFIAILETDDYVDADMYGGLYELAAKGRLDYTKCDYDTYSVDEKGDRFFSTRRVGRDKSLYEGTFDPKTYPDIAFDDWYIWNGIYRTDFLRRNNIRFSETAGAAFQDIGFLHRTTSRAGSVQYLPRSLYRYCVSRPEASSKSDRTIQYIRQEYGILCDELLESAGTEERNLLYRRMAKSFARAFMDCSKATLVTDEANEITEWFAVRLEEAKKNRMVIPDILPAGLRDSYRHLMVSRDDYLTYRNNRADEIKDFLGENHPVVIFGCGIYGRDALDYINALGQTVNCFMDNSEKLWGRTINGLLVNDPKNITLMPNDTRYVVANENHADEIAEQIREHVGAERILIF